MKFKEESRVCRFQPDKLKFWQGARLVLSVDVVVVDVVVVLAFVVVVVAFVVVVVGTVVVVVALVVVVVAAVVVVVVALVVVVAALVVVVVAAVVVVVAFVVVVVLEQVAPAKPQNSISLRLTLVLTLLPLLEMRIMFADVCGKSTCTSAADVPSLVTVLTVVQVTPLSLEASIV